MNPAREVKTERFSRTEGKTPAFVDGEVQKLLDTVDASTHTGLRDRALLGVLAYTFARIGAVVNLKVEALKRKAAKRKSFPCTISSRSSSTSILKQPAWIKSQALPFFRPLSERAVSYRAGRSFVPMRRTCSNDDSNKPVCRLTIRLTLSGRPGSRIFWKTTALLKPLNESPATPIAGRRNSMTVAAKRFSSKIWSGFGIEGPLCERFMRKLKRFSRL